MSLMFIHTDREKVMNKSEFRLSYERVVDLLNVGHEITGMIYIEDDFKERQRLVKQLRSVCDAVKAEHVELCAGEEMA